VALENSRFIENTKATLENKDLAVKGGESAPKNFKGTSNPYFHGYKFDPKVAEVIDDLSGNKRGGFINAIGRVLRQTIVYMPIKHDLNEAAFYAIDRGLSKLLNPAAYYRMGRALASATKDVINQDGTYRQMLRAGSSLMTADDKQLGKIVASQLKDMSDNPRTVMDIAKAVGSSPARIYRAIQKVTVWDVQDILNTALVKEKMRPTLFTKGKSFEDALKETEKYGLQYKVPTRAGLPGKAGRSIAETLKSPKVFFGRYTYDKYRVTSNIVKGTANITKPGQALKNADKLAVMVLGAALVWPKVEGVIKKATGNPNAHVTAPGPLSIIQKGIKVAQGKETPEAAVSSEISIGTPVKMGLDLYNNMDSFTGKPIADNNAPLAQRVDQRLNWMVSQLSPVQKYTAAQKNVVSNKVISTILSLAGTSLPKNSPEQTKLNSYKFDSLPMLQTYVKAQEAAGNPDVANQAMQKYNDGVLSAYKSSTQKIWLSLYPQANYIERLRQRQTSQKSCRRSSTLV
jgi:hypothetical protein